MSQFIYQGPVASVSLNRGELGPLDLQFHPGGLVEAPADNEYIAQLVRTGRLTPVPAPEAEPASVARAHKTKTATGSDA